MPVILGVDIWWVITMTERGPTERLVELSECTAGAQWDVLWYDISITSSGRWGDYNFGGWGSQLHLAGNYKTASPHNSQPPHLCVLLYDGDDLKKRSDRKGDVTNELDLLSGLSLSGVCSWVLFSEQEPLADEAAQWGQWANVGCYIRLRAQMDSAFCSNQLTKVI